MFEQASDHGEVKAQHNLGALFATGRGVPQSYAEAAKWYGLAARRGDQAAGSILEKIRSVQARGKLAIFAAGGTYAAREFRFRRRRDSPWRAHRTDHVPVSSPVMEQRTVHIGPSPSAGFHAMGGMMGGGPHTSR